MVSINGVSLSEQKMNKDKSADVMTIARISIDNEPAGGYLGRRDGTFEIAMFSYAKEDLIKERIKTANINYALGCDITEEFFDRLETLSLLFLIFEKEKGERKYMYYLEGCKGVNIPNVLKGFTDDMAEVEGLKALYKPHKVEVFSSEADFVR